MYLFAKKLVASVMAMAMTVGISATAMAAEDTDIKVQINGVNLNLEGNAAILKDDRSYVPMRTIFEGLGAEVSYDPITKTVAATRSSETVQFVIGSPEITLFKGGEKSVVEAEVTAFVENDTTYVPVNFVATALDCVVNFDDATKTVIIVDPNKLTSELAGKFTIMDKYMQYSKEFSATAQKFSGTLKYDMKITDPTATANEKGSEIPIILNGTMSGIVDAEKMNMKIALTVDPASLKAFIEQISAEDTKAVPDTTATAPAVAPDTTEDVALTAAEEIKQVTDLLSNLNFEMIMDLTSGKAYMKAPAIATSLDADKDAWYELDFNALYELAGLPTGSMNSLLQLNKSESFVEMVTSMLKIMPIKTTAESEALGLALKSYTDYFADTAFTKEADGYVMNYKDSANGVETVMSMKLTEASNKITGYRLSASTSMPGVTDMKIRASQSGSNSSVAMDFSIPGLMSMLFNADMKFIPTTDIALSKPIASEKIVSLNDLMNSVLVPETGAEEVTTNDEVPATEVPATEVPTTEVPTTEVPATEVPATDAPATDAPAPEADVAPAA